MIEHVCYPVFPPDGHAEQVLTWLRERGQARGSRPCGMMAR